MNMVNSLDNKIIANTEILNILKKLKTEFIYKIPIEVIEYLNNNSLIQNPDKYPGFDENGEIKVSNEAEEILIYLYLKYWSDEKERKELIEIYKNNEKELKEKYDIQRIFEQDNSNNIENKDSKNLSIVEKKDTIFNRILNKIKSFLHI